MRVRSRTSVAADTGCPKQMVYGPCQGVTAEGGCEVDGRSCPFFARGAVPYSALPSAPRQLNPGAERLVGLLAERPVILTEVPSDGPDPARARASSERLSTRVDGIVLGDAPWARVQLPPSLRAGIAAESGLLTVPGLTCRDRNRVALEAELHALDAVHASAVLCLTGDHTALGSRPDAQPVFDLDSTRLAALATRRSSLVAVAERPTREWPHRLDRLRAKVAAGADMVILNHAPAEQAAEFIRSAKQAFPLLVVIASVPVVLSAEGRRRLAAFGGGTLESGNVGAAERAHDHAIGLLSAGADGIDLSAAAGADETRLALDALHDVGGALRAAVVQSAASSLPEHQGR
ncbi:hypothetical protein VD659_03380 [Herbiconiux sp. 11R-BC]|uniref:hypothetical protein n=1 Tax=Herbiconiux sp. 11R-BC TaxID=3111637 RepID=UPI003C07BA07